MTTDHSEEGYIPTTLECAMEAMNKMRLDISPSKNRWFLCTRDKWQRFEIEFMGNEDEPLRSVLERWYLND